MSSRVKMDDACLHSTTATLKLILAFEVVRRARAQTADEDNETGEGSDSDDVLSLIARYMTYLVGVLALITILVCTFKLIRIFCSNPGSFTAHMRYKCCGGSPDSQRPNSLSLDSVENENRGNASDPPNTERSTTHRNDASVTEISEKNGLCQASMTYESFAPSSANPQPSDSQPSDQQTKDVEGTMPLVAPPSYENVLSNEDYYINKQ